MENPRIGSFPVRRVGFGAMQLPGPGVFGPPQDRDRALRVLRLAVELGVDHIDTAQFYGPDVANELIREALHPYPDHLVLVSKVGARRDDSGAWLPAVTPAELRAGVEENLRSLGTDRLHAVNLRFMPAPVDGRAGEQFAAGLQAMVEMKRDGLIDGIGLSNVSVDQLRLAGELTRIACVQNPMNVLDRSSAAVLAACEDMGVAFVPFFPLGSAFAADNPVLGSPVVQATAARLGVTPAQVALAWLLHQGPHVALIPGTASPDHLRENLAASDVVLDDRARRDLDALATVG